MSKKCIIDGCGRDAVYRFGVCHRCYQALWYWRKKSVAEIVGRKNKLQMFMARMDIVEPKVRVMPRKRARR